MFGHLQTFLGTKPTVYHSNADIERLFPSHLQQAAVTAHFLVSCDAIGRLIWRKRRRNGRRSQLFHLSIVQSKVILSRIWLWISARRVSRASRVTWRSGGPDAAVSSCVWGVNDAARAKTADTTALKYLKLMKKSLFFANCPFKSIH